jgi:hypothetical protein
MSKKSIIGYVGELGAVVTEDTYNNDVCIHNMYGMSKRFQVPNNATRYIIIDPSNIECEKLIFLPVVFKAFGAGTINIDLHANPTYIAGTEWDTIDRCNTDIEIAKTKIYFNTSVTAEGTKLAPEWEVFSNGIAAVSVLGGEAKDDLPFIADKNITYMFKIVNNDTTNTARCTVSFNFSEKKHV